MNLSPGPKTRFRAMLAIWGYDVAKFLVLYSTMEGFGINPWVFFFLDMITVPTYIMGWSRLMASITGEIQTFRAIFTWSLMTFVSSTAPYFYAAFAGLRTFPQEIWWFLALILLFSLINLIRKIRRAKKAFAQ